MHNTPDHPANGEQALNRAKQLMEAGEFAAAAHCMGEALQSQPANPDYIATMAQALMPGPGYKQWLRRLHRELSPGSYLEIGVSKGMSLSLAGAQTSCVGIDPAFQIEAEITAPARLYPCTSDHFFKHYDLMDELRTETLDMVFIDGLHLFEQVLKDFINVERYATGQTVVLVHDCYPVSDLTASRERQTDFWSGDVWKIVPCLRRERPDLAVNVIPSKPCGLAVITGLDPHNRKLAENIEAISERYVHTPYSAIPEQRGEFFSAVENQWRSIRALLPLP